MKVKILNLNLKNTHYYPYNKVNSIYEPLISYNYKTKYNYTQIIVDLDAVNPDGGRYILLHMLKINNSKQIMEYIPPKPPINSGIHRYLILILRQKELLNIDIKNRENFNLKKFIVKNKLIIEDKFYFTTSR